ncbi:MAG: pyrroline-5-carboxylate reductase, partial [Nitrospinales bacterium]
LHTLEEGGLRTTLINAVEMATKRSMTLGSNFRNAAAEKDNKD